MKYINITNWDTVGIQESRAARILGQLGIGDVISIPPYKGEVWGTRTGTIKKFHKHLVELEDERGHLFYIRLNRFKAQSINIIFSNPDKEFDEMYNAIVEELM